MDFSLIKRLQIPKLDLRNIEWPRFDFAVNQWLKMPKLRIGDAVTKLPIVQGGMAVGISLSGLASAVANEEKIDLVFLGAGLPIKGIPVEDLRTAGVKVIPIVSSARAAGLIFRSWSKK